MTAAKYHARPGNKNAAKPAGEKKGASLFVRTKKPSKGNWRTAAKRAGKSLNQWVEDTLNSRAK